MHRFRPFRALAVLLGILHSAIPFSSASAAPASELVVAVDLSGSMAGSRLAETQKALNQLVNDVDPRIAIGLVTFSDTASLQVAPTLDHQLVKDALLKMKSGGRTALYDGLLVSLNALTQPKGLVLAICDGEDNSSKAVENDVEAAAQAKEATVSAVAIRPTAVQARSLAALTSKLGGIVVTANDVGEILSSLASAIAIDSVTPSPTITPTPTPTPSQPYVDEYGLHSSTEKILGAILAGLVALSFIFLAPAWWQWTERRKLKILLEQVRPLESDKSKKKSRVLSVVAFLQPALKSRWQAFVLLLGDAGISIPARDWVLRRALMFVIITGLCTLLFKNAILAVLLSLFGSIYLGYWSINRSREKMGFQFDGELNGALLVLASSLRAGLSFVQALETLSRESQGEVARQFRRAVAEISIGSTVEDALYRVADRVRSDDLRWVIAALAIQREVGGSLASILTATSDMIQNRFALKREVRALSAEGRMSAQVLIAMPILFFLFFLATRPEYLSIFWTTTLGFVLLSVMALLEIAGIAWIRKVVKVKI